MVMNKSEKTIKEWVENFRNSVVYNKEASSFDPAIAKRIFKGSNKSCSIEVPANFLKFSIERRNYKYYDIIKKLINYLSAFGIVINPDKLKQYIGASITRLNLIMDKSHFIIFKLANTKNVIDRENPFQECMSQVIFLAKVENGIIDREYLFDPKISQSSYFKEKLSLPDNFTLLPNWKVLFDEIENTNNNFVLYGAAGNGKSVFLKYFLMNTSKKVLVLGTTGKAASLISGNTIHSVFQFKKGLLAGKQSVKILNQRWLNFEALKKAETIIIDEVSMLRSDVFHAIDISLRRNVGDAGYLFGGKQIILVGDFYQLPPVVNYDNSIEKYYFQSNSKYFFQTTLFANNMKFKLIEFKIPFRHSDDPILFQILNEIRNVFIEENREIDEKILRIINSQIIDKLPDKMPPFTTILTNDNYKVKVHNNYFLEKVSSQEFIYEDEKEGTFSYKNKPFITHLALKVGVPIMFLNNDEKKRWVNGSLGVVDSLEEDSIKVRLVNGETHKIEKVTFSNDQDVLKFDNIKSETIGKITRYPIVLAYAMTIHRSQGDTLENVIIDLRGNKPLEGRLLYTALSRVKKLSAIQLFGRALTKEDFYNFN